MTVTTDVSSVRLAMAAHDLLRVYETSRAFLRWHGGVDELDSLGRKNAWRLSGSGAACPEQLGFLTACRVAPTQ